MLEENVEEEFKVVDKESLEKFEAKKEKVDDVMSIIKACGLDKDQEFMDEIQEAIDVSLKN
jgi:hypothetical protein